MIEINNKIKAQAAIKNRLFVSGWLLNNILHKVKDGSIEADIELFYEDDIAVGVAVNITEENYNDYKAMIFFKKQYRNKGIGSKLIKQLNPKSDTMVGKGVPNSLNFLIKNGYKNIA